MKIASVVARQLLDCKARPLVEVEITTDTGHVGAARRRPAVRSVCTKRSCCVTETSPNTTG